MSVDLLESADMSETRLSLYLAKTIREISKAGGISIPGLGPPPFHEGTSAPASRPGSRGAGVLSSADDLSASLASNGGGGGGGAAGIGGMGSGMGAGGGGGLQEDTSAFDWENFLQTENNLELGLLLGLPGDDQSMIPGMMGNGGMVANGVEFGFGNSTLR